MIDFFQDDNWFKYHILSASSFCHAWDRIWNKFCFYDTQAKEKEKKDNSISGTSAIDKMIAECNET